VHIKKQEDNMQVTGSTAAAVNQAREIGGNQNVKAASAQKTPVQEYDKVTLSDSAKSMAAAQKTK
jgi:hypothetical protein